MSTIPTVFDNLVLSPKDRASINYAKARCAIETHLKCRADKRAAKMAVIEYLQGTIVHPTVRSDKNTTFVLFSDHTKARF